ncbi:MAG: hypothetical protein KF706_09895 [Chitinophagales bacterium]|nr:hypothetical protein [Chitinophagales bacterium]
MFKGKAQITGSGTIGYLPKFTNTSTVDNSSVYQSGTFIGVNSATPQANVDIYGACGSANAAALRVTQYGGFNALCLGGGTLGDNFIVKTETTQGTFWNHTNVTLYDFIVKNTGDVGIGTFSPAATLYVRPNSSTKNPLQITNSAESATYLMVNKDGNVGIGTASPAAPLHIKNSVSNQAALVAYNSTNYQTLTLRDEGSLGINTSSTNAIVDAKMDSWGIHGWLYHGQTAAGATRFVVTENGRASIGSTPAFNESTLTLKSALGSSSTTNLDMVAPGSTGWANQLRFLAGNNAIRHVIADDYTNGKNDLLLAPGNGGNAAAVVRIKGKAEVGADVANPNRSNYTGALFVRGDGVGIDIYNQQATSGWNNQIRFSGTGGIRHLIADDYGTNNLLIKPGHGGGANNIVEVQGRIRIGSFSPIQSVNSNWKLAVDGEIQARQVTVQTLDWSDYVFDDDYKLLSLEEIESFVKTNKHLPGIPSEQEVLTNGINLGEMNKLLLQKIEELTLQVILLNQKIKP